MTVPTDPKDRALAELTEEIDRHWLTLVSGGGAACSCGGWVFDARDPDLGEHLRPFSEHVASAVLARTATAEAAALDLQTERDLAEAYYRTLETHLREHGCDHDFALVANENGRLGADQ